MTDRSTSLQLTSLNFSGDIETDHEHTIAYVNALGCHFINVDYRLSVNVILGFLSTVAEKGQNMKTGRRKIHALFLVMTASGS